MENYFQLKMFSSKIEIDVNRQSRLRSFADSRLLIQTQTQWQKLFHQN